MAKELSVLGVQSFRRGALIKVANPTNGTGFK
jgi:hypothetical protein